MSTQRYSVTPHPIETLLAWVKSGEIAIPEIQRPFVWEATKVRNLLDSLYQGYPVGYLIAWRNPTVKLKDGSSAAGKRILIDGQQRVTALMAALLGGRCLTKDYETVRIRIAFHPAGESLRGHEPGHRQGRRVDTGRGRGLRAEREHLPARDQLLPDEPEVSQDAIFASMERLRKIINNHVGIIELADDLDIETVTEIFIRVNSAGASLSPGRLRHVQDRCQRDLRRQPAAQGHRLLLPPCRGAGVPISHRKGRHGLRAFGVPAADALAEGRQRRSLRSHLHGHAAGRLHLRVRPRQVAGPRRAARPGATSPPSSTRRPSPRRPSAGSSKASSPSSKRRTSTASP